jgi:hypothetical protein
MSYEQDDNECIHSIYPFASCTRCSGKDDAVARAAREIHAVWTAKYLGECSRCDGSIDVGEKMGRDMGGRYVCARCIAATPGRIVL